MVLKLLKKNHNFKVLYFVKKIKTVAYLQIRTSSKTFKLI